MIELLILDRSFDLLSPLLRDPSFGAISNDSTGKTQEKQEKDEEDFWLKIYFTHITKVVDAMKDRINNMENSEPMELPEYTQIMTELGQHVAIAQQCMDVFSKQGLLDLSQMEQTISTGLDQEGNEVKSDELLALVTNQLRKNMRKEQRIRLLAIYYVSQRNIPGADKFIQKAVTAADLSESEVSVISNFGRIMGPPEVASGSPMAARRPTAEGEYRHVCTIKSLLEQFISNTLPVDTFSTLGPAPANSSKNEAKFGEKGNVMMGSIRYLVFIADGLAYPEMRVAYDLMQKESREVIIGGSHLINPSGH